MIFWIILIIVQLVDTVLMIKFMKGNTVVKVEQKNVYVPVQEPKKKYKEKYYE